jgi:ketosteroid isomerase-like protein
MAERPTHAAKHQKGFVPALLRSAPGEPWPSWSMKPSRVLCFALFFLLMLPLANPLTAGPSNDDLQSRIREFLDLYAKKDVAGVMNLVSSDSLVVMGSDLSEVCTRREQVEELLRNDFRLWDSAFFGKPVQVYTHESESLITAFFDVPLTMRRGGGEQTLVVRFATGWQKTKQGLKLVQSANTTPTVGQSAKDLLAPKRTGL